MLNMDVGQSIVAEVLVDKSLHEFDAMHHRSLLMENGIAKPFEDMLVVFVHCDVVNTNKVVEQFQITKKAIDCQCAGKWGDVS
jgi:hypothetical protein